MIFTSILLVSFICFCGSLMGRRIYKKNLEDALGGELEIEIQANPSVKVICIFSFLIPNF